MGVLSNRLVVYLAVLPPMLSACAASRTPPAAAAPGPPAPEILVPAGEPPRPADVVPVADRVDRLVAEAGRLFKRGEKLFRDGEIEAGRSSFEQSLSTLRDSDIGFFENPRLEISYYDLMSRMRKLELEYLIDPVAVQLPSVDRTPKEEIAELDPYSIEVDPKLAQKVSQDLLDTRFSIPVVLNDAVVRFLNYYQTRGREIMDLGLRRAGRYLPLIRKVLETHGLPPDLAYIPHVESLFNPRAYSRARARGLWQFVAATARTYGLKQDWWIDERSDIVRSTEAAARHLKDLHDKFQDWHLVLAAYNGGANRIERRLRRYGPLDFWTMHRRRMLPRETRNYVPSLLAAVIIFSNPERYGFEVKREPPLEFETVKLDEQVDLRVAAGAVGITPGALLDLNPELRRGVTPWYYDDYRLKVPPRTAGRLLKKLASLPPEQKVRFRHHKVRRGESLSVIARRYRTSMRAIAQVNRIRNVHRLREGQDLIIPLPSTSGLPLRAAQLPNSPDIHVVRSGESLSRIARLYGVRLPDLLRWNNLRADQIIHPGQKIRILDETREGARAGSAPQQ